MKTRFNYSTDDTRIKELKKLAIDNDLYVNDILDYFIDICIDDFSIFDFNSYLELKKII